MLHIGIDCGTQGTKALLWDAHNKKVLATSYATYDVISERVGQKEQNPELWIAAMGKTVREVLARSQTSPDKIGGIGISGQQHGLVLLDEHDALLRPAKLWCDTEPEQELVAFKARFLAEQGIRLEEALSIHVPVAFTLAKLLWVQAHEPQLFCRVQKILLPHEYINYWLTGRYCSEYGDASGTGLFNTTLRCWSASVAETVHSELYAKLPPLIASHEAAGELSEKAALLLGLTPGITVASGGGDNMMAALGTGNTREAVLTMSLGTSGTLFTHTQQPFSAVSDPDINGFCSSTNGWLPLISTMNVTNAVNAISQLLSVKLDEREALLRQSLPGAGGVYCFPWFTGARFPNIPSATASFHGITTENFKKENLLRCVVEAVTFKLCKGIEHFEKQGLYFNEIRLTGGGAKSDIWCQLVADVSGLPVVRPRVTEAAALGAALQSQWCQARETCDDPQCTLQSLVKETFNDYAEHIFKPDPNVHPQYRALYETFHARMKAFIT